MPRTETAQRPNSYRRGYDRAWSRLRSLKLSHDPLCEWCAKQDRVTSAEVVDHVVPIRDDPDRRLDYSNLQSLCAEHHNSLKQQEDHLGYTPEVGADGWPLDAKHPAYRGTGG